jgi:REP element-mobilizing transposase RayT
MQTGRNSFDKSIAWFYQGHLVAMIFELRKQRFPEVTSKLWGRHLWSPSYFATSCGGAPIAVVRQYIENQRRALTQP